MKLKLLLLGLIAILAFSCKSDDNTNTPPDDEVTLNEVIEALTNNGNVKTWKIESASFTNANVADLDVANAFNIKEDEFRFSADNETINLEHRQRNDFNRDATDLQSFLLDYYRSALNYTLTSDANNASLLTSTNNSLSFELVNDGLITGAWMFDDDTKLEFSLTVKTAEDYPAQPANLNFQEVVQIPAEYFFDESIGSSDILGSQSNSSLYLVYTTDEFTNPNGGSNRAEGVVRYDIGANSFNNNVFHNQDFFTKRAFISNNSFKVIGSGYLNIYEDLDIVSNPESTIDYNPESGSGIANRTYFRHDVIIYNNDILVIGGSPNSIDDPDIMGDYFDKILIYDEASNNLSDLTTLPTPKCQAATEIADGKIYAFSGTRGFIDFGTAETLSYVYDIDTNTFDSFDLPEALSVSFATTNENLIYVAGQVRVLDINDSVIDINAYLGVYNTETGVFSEIAHNLDDSDELSRISGITYLSGKLYIVYQNSNDPDNENYVIMSADL